MRATLLDYRDYVAASLVMVTRSIHGRVESSEPPSSSSSSSSSSFEVERESELSRGRHVRDVRTLREPNLTEVDAAFPADQVSCILPNWQSGKRGVWNSNRVRAFVVNIVRPTRTHYNFK